MKALNKGAIPARIVFALIFHYSRRMLLSRIIRCAQYFSYRMFPMFPQLQLVVPVAQRMPLTLTNGEDPSEKKDLASWINESFLLFAAPKKRVGLEKVLNRIVFDSSEKTAKSFEKPGTKDKHCGMSKMRQVQAVASFVQ